MLSFNFRLQKPDEIRPWGDNPPNLHWFGLTDGWFWIDIGGQQLFRYSQQILDHWAQEPQAYVSLLPFDDYQVTRYWEDLLEMVPSILDPLPSDLAARVSDIEAWRQWRERLDVWREASEDDASMDIGDAAIRWWISRTWDNGHLSRPPKIWLWSIDDTVHIRWDCRNILLDGIEVWEARSGEVAMSKSEFVNAVKSFDERLIGEMGKRIEEIKSSWSRPEVIVDVESLEQEQNYRATIGENALGRTHRDYEWDQVRAAMAMIETNFEQAK
ncbi:MAG: DUF5984 family protein [Capsulimonas sp.]|uniref:DUF5984 family protein n=1 Tax=Capsulimonas sp. TaxID=2494211 RepID=UPI0032659F66